MKLYELLIFCFIALVLTTSYSCDELGITEIDTTSCPKRWSVYNYQSTSYVIGDSALRIFSDSLANGIGIEFVNLNTLTGDFEINIDFHNYYVEGGGLGFFVQLIAHAPNGLPNNSVKATIGNVFPGLFGTRVAVGIDSSGTDPPVIVAKGNYANASDTSGFFTIKRTGSTMELTASTGDSSATITGGFYSSPLTFSIQYGSNFNPIAKTSITLRRFRVIGGGGSVIDDYFDCNSIQQP